MIYTELTAPLEDAEGTVIIQSNVGRAKDKSWVRNLTKAKELASTGRVTSIIVKSVVSKETLHSFYALRSAIGSGHPALSVCVTGDRPEDVAWLKERAAKMAPLACENACQVQPKRGRPKGSKNKVKAPIVPDGVSATPKISDESVIEWLSTEEQYQSDVESWLAAEKEAV